jgi:hypothetical protein
MARGSVRRRAAPIQSRTVGFGMRRAGAFAGLPREGARFARDVREEDATKQSLFSAPISAVHGG